MYQNKLATEELVMIQGGAITATFFNSISRLFSTVIDFGRQLGSSIRRLINGKFCKL